MGSTREEPDLLADEEASALTKQRVAAAKQYIENHYKEQMRNLQERRERYRTQLKLVLASLFLKEHFSLHLCIKYSYFNSIVCNSRIILKCYYSSPVFAAKLKISIESGHYLRHCYMKFNAFFACSSHYSLLLLVTIVCG